MRRNFAVESGEDLRQNEENVDGRGIGHDDRQLLNGISSRIKAGQLAQGQTQKDQQSRAGSKSGSQETRRQDRRQPIRSAGQSAIEKCGDGVNADRQGIETMITGLIQPGTGTCSRCAVSVTTAISAFISR